MAFDIDRELRAVTLKGLGPMGCDLADLDPTLARAIRDLAARAEVIELAKKLALDPLVLVIGLLARMQADRNRSAARIARAIFGKRPRREVDEAAATAGIA